MSADQVVVNPWTVKGKINDEKYLKLINEFGAQQLTEDLIERFEKLTGSRAHHLMRRGIFSAHRDFDKVLDDFENGKEIFLYTGRGPSGDVHLGHVVPMEVTAYLQRAFKCWVVFQMADDEKVSFRGLKLEDVHKHMYENAKDVMALGFIPEKTFMFSNNLYKGNEQYKKVVDYLNNKVSINDIKKIFGLDDSCSVGQLTWPVYQSAAAFSQAFPIFKEQARCLVVYALDQDPYFRLCRDNCNSENGWYKPAALMCKFLPALEGESKMSTTGDGGEVKTIFMTDTKEEVYYKIKKFAFSGGRDTLEEHRRLGGNTEVDMCFQYLRFLAFTKDDAELLEIKEKYESGKMLTSELKQITSEEVWKMIEEHKRKREEVGDLVEFFRA